jgi:hypothetical protein
MPLGAALSGRRHHAARQRPDASLDCRPLIASIYCGCAAQRNTGRTPRPSRIARASGADAGRTMLRFLQLSDIHFRSATERIEGSPADVQELDYELREQLIVNASQVVPQAGGVSGVVVAGDLANKGVGAEFAQATAWLQNLCSAIDVPPWMVWVVPGNHDIDCTAIGGVQREQRQQIRGAGEHASVEFSRLLGDPAQRAALLKPLHNYLECASGYDCMFKEGLHWSERLPVEGATLEIRGLTSAVLCDKGDSTEKLRTLIGDDQANFPAADGTIIYTLCHHPRCWLLDRDELEAWFEERVHVRVTGHLHRRRLRASAAGVHLRAGAVSPTRLPSGEYKEPEVPSYELISIADTGNNTVAISVAGHRWTEESQDWEPDTSESGALSVSVDLQSPGPPQRIPQLDARPATRLHLPLREVRYRLAQLAAYDREQCAKEIQAPMRDVMMAAAHEQVEVIMRSAEQNGMIETLKDAVANRSGGSDVEASVDA